MGYTALDVVSDHFKRRSLMHSAKNIALIALMAFMGFSVTASAAEPTEASAAQTVVDDAVSTLQNFESDAKQSWFRQNVSKARAVFIIPHLNKGGFIFGGSGGRGFANS